MRTHRTTTWGFCGAMVLIGLATLAYCQEPIALSQANKETQLASILKDWQRRWDRAQAVEYILEGRRLIPKGYHSRMNQDAGGPIAPELVGQTVPPEDYWFPTRRRVVVDFVNNRFRREYRGQMFKLDAGEYYNFFQVDLYDGESLQIFRPREENVLPDDPNDLYQAELFLQKHNSLRFSLSRLDESFLTPHARFPRFNGPPGVFTRLEQPLNHEAYYITGSALVGNTECVVVRTATNAEVLLSYFEYWVDPARESAILKIVHRLPEYIMQTHEIEYVAQQASWYPKRIVLTELLKGGGLEAREELTVTGMTINPKLTDSLFHMAPEEGMVVYKEEERNKYLTQDDGELVDLSTALSRERRWDAMKWWLIAILGLALVTAVVLWRKKSRSN